MNNEKMNICQRIINKYTLCPHYFEFFDQSVEKIKVFLVHNTYDDEIVSEHENSLALYNRKTKRKYIVSKKGTDIIERCIEYLPNLGEANSYPQATEENAEAVAFSLSYREIICYRVNSKGLFIENFNFFDKKIITDYYDREAISTILSKAEDNYTTLIELLNKLGVTEKTEKCLLSTAECLINLNPDSRIICESDGNNFIVKILRDGVLIDYLKIETDQNRPLYTDYIYFMRDLDFYQDTHSPLRARKH